MSDETQPARPRTVLVVDDEDPVRALLERTLQKAGYTVLTCSSSEEAIEVSATLGRRIDVLVTDIVMRGVNGRELARRLQQSHPGLRVLLISGFTRQQLGVKDPEVAYLEKPFSPREVVQRVGELLGTGPGTGDGG